MLPNGLNLQRVLLRLALPLLLWGTVLTVPASAQVGLEEETPRTIRNLEISFSGASSLTEEIVLANMSVRAGAPYDEALVDRDIRALYAIGLFDLIEVHRVDVSETEVDLKFEIRPKILIGAVRFEGNERISSRKLRTATEMRIQNNVALDERLVKEDADKILEYYRKKGYSQVRVDYVIERNPVTGFGSVTFRIDEGNKVKLKHVEFVGNENIKDSALRKKMKTRRWWIFSFMTGSGKFTDEQFQEDLESVRDFYRQEGYLDVEIDPAGITFAYPTPKDMIVTIPVKEGKQYRIGEISISGNELFPSPVLLGFLSIRPGDVFSPDKIDEETGKLGDFYGQFGYLETRVYLQRTPNVSTGAIDIEFVVRESEQYHVESINIEGNTKTKSVVVLRELLLAPGDVFDTVRMETSRIRLENTRFFEDVNVTDESTNIPGRKTLGVTFREGPTGQLMFGAGFSSLQGAVFFIELSQSNFDLFNYRSFFQGDGQKFRLKLEVGSQSNEIILAFEEPWLFEQQIALGFQVYRTESDYTSSVYDELRAGFEVYVRKRLIELIEGRLSYRLESVDIFNISPNFIDIIGSLGGKTQISKVGLRLLRDTRNNLLTPTRGSRLEAYLEVAGGPFGGDVDYYKLEGRMTQYFPLFEFQKQVIEIQGRLGTVKEFGDTTDVPFFDRFFLGGQDTLRGFEYREVGPKTFFGEPTGGKSYGYFTMEYSMTVVGEVRAAFFYDGGFVNKGSFDFTPANYNDNYGFGVRFMMMGQPMRIDYGIPLTTDGRNDRGPQFNFSFGSRF